METAEVTGIPKITELAKELREVQEKTSDLNAELKELASRKEKLSTAIVQEMELMGNDDQMATGLILEGVGVVKLETRPFPRILAIDDMVRWAKSTGQLLPPLTINHTTLTSWVAEQHKLNLPMPPVEVMSLFWKTSAKVNKRG